MTHFRPGSLPQGRRRASTEVGSLTADALAPLGPEGSSPGPAEPDLDRRPAPAPALPDESSIGRADRWLRGPTADPSSGSATARRRRRAAERSSLARFRGETAMIGAPRPPRRTAGSWDAAAAAAAAGAGGAWRLDVTAVWLGPATSVAFAGASADDRGRLEFGSTRESDHEVSSSGWTTMPASASATAALSADDAWPATTRSAAAARAVAATASPWSIAGSWPPLRGAASGPAPSTAWMTSAFGQASHTPSDPSTRNRSHARSRRCQTSGSARTYGAYLL